MLGIGTDIAPMIHGDLADHATIPANALLAAFVVLCAAEDKKQFRHSIGSVPQRSPSLVQSGLDDFRRNEMARLLGGPVRRVSLVDVWPLICWVADN
jgi:hypothetical protein